MTTGQEVRFDGSRVEDAGANRHSQVDFGYRQVPEGEKIHRVLGHFQAVARRYDLMNSLLSLGIHRLWKLAAVKALGLRPGERVLDLCGGTGDLAVLSQRGVGRSGSVVLYDLSRAMMTAGMPKVRRHGHSSVHFVQGDAENLALRSRAFDRVIVGFGLRNLTHLDRGFLEIHRILKPGGRMVCLEFAKPDMPLFRWLYDRYSFRVMPFIGLLVTGSREAYTYLAESIRVFSSPDEMSELMKSAGFTAVRYRRLTNGIAVLHEANKGL